MYVCRYTKCKLSFVLSFISNDSFTTSFQLTCNTRTISRQETTFSRQKDIISNDYSSMTRYVHVHWQLQSTSFTFAGVICWSIDSFASNFVPLDRACMRSFLNSVEGFLLRTTTVWSSNDNRICPIAFQDRTPAWFYVNVNSSDLLIVKGNCIFEIVFLGWTYAW